MITRFFALTTRGLETVVQAELASVEGVQIRSLAYRRIHAVMDGDFGLLTTIRTADDLFLEVAAWDNIRHTRDMLAEFSDLSAALDLQTAIDSLQTVRTIPASITFSVTANFVGQRNYNYHEIKAAVAAGISRRYSQWAYVEDDGDAVLNVRIFIEHEVALVGVRLTTAPLHRRSYKQTSLEGSLKPPVAAAMIQLANLKKGQRLVDPFCGSGTIVIEAAQQGLIAIGGDVNREALQVSQDNAVRAGQQIKLALWNAQRMPLANESVQAAVSNLPWGKQVKIDESLRSLYQRSFEEMRRVISPEGVLVLLTTLPEFIPETPRDLLEISVYGQTPQVMVFKSSG